MKRLFIGVDLQNDFMNKDGALYVPGAEEIKQNVKNLINNIYVNNKEKSYLWFTLDSHLPQDPEINVISPDFVNTFPVHCLIGSDGQFFIDEVNNTIPDHCWTNEMLDIQIFIKHVFSIFEYSNEFLEALQKEAYFDEIYVFGVAGDVCVKAVLDGINHNIGSKFNYGHLYLVKDCVASINDEQFMKHLALWKLINHHFHVINSTDINFGE